jgi:hypothetical protein
MYTWPRKGHNLSFPLHKHIFEVFLEVLLFIKPF